MQSKAPCGWGGGRGETETSERRCESRSGQRERERSTDGERGKSGDSGFHTALPQTEGDVLRAGGGASR